MTDTEMAAGQEADRKIYDPGFPAIAPRFRPLSAPRTYQGRSYIRASTGGQIRRTQIQEIETKEQAGAERPARCASAPEKAFTYNGTSDRQPKSDGVQASTTPQVSPEAEYFSQSGDPSVSSHDTSLSARPHICERLAQALLPIPETLSACVRTSPSPLLGCLPTHSHSIALRQGELLVPADFTIALADRLTLHLSPTLLCSSFAPALHLVATYFTPCPCSIAPDDSGGMKGGRGRERARARAKETERGKVGTKPL